MTTDRQLDEVLAELGREHRAIAAAETLERVLCAAAGGRKASIGMPWSRFKWALVAVVVLLAAIATGGALWQTRRSSQPQAQHARSVHAPPLGPASSLASVKAPERQDFQSKSAPMRKARSTRVDLRNSSSKQPAWNSLDEFVALPVSEGLPVAAELSVVRVRLRGSDLQQYGLQAPSDRAAQTLLAEFVVGEDGLPRAIRIVR
jgi:hypothetical protein